MRNPDAETARSGRLSLRPQARDPDPSSRPAPGRLSRAGSPPPPTEVPAILAEPEILFRARTDAPLRRATTARYLYLSQSPRAVAKRSPREGRASSSGEPRFRTPPAAAGPRSRRRLFLQA